MEISFKQIKVGSEWDRPALAKLWGYKSYAAIARGAVTPSGDNKIVLFITREKQSNATQYEDSLANGMLKIQGETNHAADERIVNAEQAGDEIHLFYRDKHHQPFKYHGLLSLTKSTLFSQEPSKFVFRLAS